MARGAPVRFSRWTGGLNTQAGPYDLDDRESPEMLNVVASPRGAIRKRDGYRDMGSDANIAEQIKSLGRITGVSGATKLVAGSDTKLYALVPGAAAVQLFTGGTSSEWEFLQAAASGGQGPLYAMNASNTPQQWNGSAGSTSNWTASSGSVPNGKFMVLAGNRVFAAGSAAEPSGVQFSNIGDPRDWPSANIVRFDPGDGESITGLGVVGPYVLVFKPNKTWVIYDLDSGANRQLGENVGTRSHRSIVETPRGTFFLDADQGVMVTDGQSAKRVSEQITPDLEALPVQYLHRVAGAFWRNHYYLSVPNSAGVPAYVYDFDSELGSWWKHDCAAWDYVVTDFPTDADTVLRDELLFGCLKSTARWAQFFRPGQRSDQIGATAANIAFSWKSAPHLLDGRVDVKKRIAELRIDGQGFASLQCYRDFNTSPDPLGDLEFAVTSGELWGTTIGSTWGVSTSDAPWAGYSSLAQVRVHTLGVARTWAFAVSGSTTLDFELESITALVGPHRRRD